jgi:hypothetical protein
LYGRQHRQERPPPPTGTRPARPPARFGAVLALQRKSGNRAVSSLLRPSGRRLQRQHLDITGAGRFNTPTGWFYRFDSGTHHTNSANRPFLRHTPRELTTYTGAGNDGAQQIHPAVATALDRMMTALLAEGARLNDESMKNAVVASAWRAPEASEGAAYLRALRKTIRLHPHELPHAFPASLETMAQSELGAVGSTAYEQFRTALAHAPDWDQGQADFLLSETGQFKAPRGGSTHHSGVVVDIDFPYVTADGTMNWHHTNRERNADAFLSAAGQWLNDHSREFGFASYSTRAEIWHQEWLDWAGTAADPSARAAPAATTTHAAAADELEDPDLVGHLPSHRSIRPW